MAIARVARPKLAAQALLRLEQERLRNGNGGCRAETQEEFDREKARRIQALNYVLDTGRIDEELAYRHNPNVRNGYRFA